MVRRAVRALITGLTDDELLLARLYVPDSGKRIWLTPGGGIESGESPLAAVQREVWEETGHKIRQPLGPVWQRSHELVFRGEHMEQHEQYFLVRMPRFEPDPSNNPAANEAELLEEFRWWSLADIAASEELFVPRKLAEHLSQLLTGPIPKTPIEVGV